MNVSARLARATVALLALGAAGCGSKRRDWRACNMDVACQSGYACRLDRCVIIPDGGFIDGGSLDARASSDGPGAVIQDAAAGTDTHTADAAPVADIGPDGPPPDGAGTCSSDAHCPGDLGHCVAGKCVACAADKDCPEGRPVCSMNGCVGCGTRPAACAERDPKLAACEIGGRCVQCTAHTQCVDSARPACASNACVPCQMGTASACSDRNATLAQCQPTTGQCVECVTDPHCTDAKRPFCMAGKCAPCQMAAAGFCAKSNAKLPACDATTGQCVECGTSADCTEAARPICMGTRCGRCATDAQCAAKGNNPGVCMSHQDGRCAGDAETVHVENKPGCAAGGATAGTTATPFCQPQGAIDAATAVGSTRRVVVIRGPVGGFVVAFNGPQLLVVGQNGAVVDPGATSDRGIHLSSGDIYLRGLRVSGMFSTGIVVESTASVRINRCVLAGNKKGGIQVNAGAFDITNTVIAGNSAVYVGGLPWSGAYLIPAVGKTARFFNNTVVSNEGPGVLCATGAIVAGAILAARNGLPDISPTCGATACCDDAGLSATYRLTASSACVDKYTGANAADDDIDGEARPRGPRVDCGADEL